MPLCSKSTTATISTNQAWAESRPSIKITPLLTTKEVSDITGIPAATFAYWRWANQGPSYSKIGRSVRYKRSVIEQWIEDCSTNTTSPEVK